MATGTINVDSFYAITISRSTTYTSDKAVAAAILLFGKSGSDVFLDVVTNNGGVASITHFGTLSGITVANDSNGYITITLPDYYDGMLINAFNNIRFTAS